MGEPYRVQLELFEGPLDLLLHLIKKNEVEIDDVPTSVITEQYLAYLDVLQELQLDVAGEYLVMAATLILIKSRALLPSEADDEEPEEIDPRADLLRQLTEYKRYREAAMALSERPLLQRDVFSRPPLPKTDGEDPALEEPPDPPPLKVTVWDLVDAFRKVLERSRPEAVHEVEMEKVSLRDRAEILLDALRRERKIQFDSLFDDASTKMEIIVTFLAVLELMKQGALQATQDERMGTIHIELVAENIDEVSIESIDEYETSQLGQLGEEDGANDDTAGS